MIHFVDKVLENLQAYIPLMQEVVWPIVVLIAIYVFRSDVRTCIDAIRKRIEEGGGLRAGPFELPSMLPATPQEQAKKLQDEVSEVTDSSTPAEEGQPEESPRNDSHREIMASYMLAEDLALKKLSAELNLKIERQVRADRGGRYIFDGVALNGKRFIAIEVKMLRRARSIIKMVRQTLDRLNIYYTSLGEDAKRHFSLILAVVISEGNADDVNRHISVIREEYQFPVHVVCYQFAVLQAEFGIE